MTKGHGSDANPGDGDRVEVDVELRRGAVVTVAVGPRELPDERPITSRESPATFRETTLSGCETLRRAADVLPRLVLRRTADEAREIGVAEVLNAVGPAGLENGRCVLALIGALRAALIDAHVAGLAEATIDLKKLQLK